MPESPEQKDIREAEARGRRQQVVDGRLNVLEDHAKQVNGQIGRMATAQEAIEGKVGDIIAKINETAAVEAARAADAKKVLDRQVTTKQLIYGLIGAVAAIGLLLTSAIAAFH